MNKANLGIAVLATSATVLLGLNLVPETTQAASSTSYGSFHLATTKDQVGGESLYVLDNASGQIAVFTYDKDDKTLRPRDVRQVREIFFGR